MHNKSKNGEALITPLYDSIVSYREKGPTAYNKSGYTQFGLEEVNLPPMHEVFGKLNRKLGWVQAVENVSPYAELCIPFTEEQMKERFATCAGDTAGLVEKWKKEDPYAVSLFVRWRQLLYYYTNNQEASDPPPLESTLIFFMQALCKHQSKMPRVL